MEARTEDIKVQTRIKKELLVEAGCISKRNKRAKVITTLFPHRFDSFYSQSNKQLFKMFKKANIKATFPAYESLEGAYNDVSAQLYMKYQGQMIATFEEQIIKIYLKRHTKLEVLSSFWIGFRNVDFFFPSLAGHTDQKNIRRRGHGIVLEIDGEIHDHEPKMRKDNSKQEYLHSLGIALCPIENRDVRTIHGERTIAQLANANKTPRLDSRARERLLTKIYIETLLCHESNEFISNLFDLDLSQALNIFEEMAHEERQ